MYSPLLASKEASIAYRNPLEVTNPGLFSDLIITLAYILDLQDGLELCHAWRVAALATTMAERVLPEYSSDVFLAGLLHDVGVSPDIHHMVQFPSAVEQRSNPEVVSHPHRGASLVRMIPGLELAAGFVEYHHEHWDGSGYPGHKQGEDIPLGAQLIRVADSVDLRGQFTMGVPADQPMSMVGALAGAEVSEATADLCRWMLSNKRFRDWLLEVENLRLLLRIQASELVHRAFPPKTDMIGKVLTVIARTVDSRHRFTLGHSERVSRYAMKIAKCMDLQHHEITKLRFAGLLHDVGKAATPAAIIDKPGPLTAAELETVRHHPVLTMNIFRNVAHLDELSWIAGHHHERWDGADYPDGLAGDNVPLLSRILAVADTVDAVTSQRPYRESGSIDETLLLLKEGAGNQFDPDVVFSILDTRCLMPDGE
jgi:putative nucleotidyltransferase with HDIG domain